MRYAWGVSDSASCKVCNQPASLQLFELSFCQRCADDPEHAPGLKIEVSHEKRDTIDQISVAYVHEVAIRVLVDEPLEVSVRFCAEHVGHKLIKVFKDEYQAGDKEFDDAIYIVNEHRASAEKLLARRGAREAIMALVGEHNDVKIEAGSIHFKAQDRGQTDLLAYLRANMALSQHIQLI